MGELATPSPYGKRPSHNDGFAQHRGFQSGTRDGIKIPKHIISGAFLSSSSGGRHRSHFKANRKPVELVSQGSNIPAWCFMCSLTALLECKERKRKAASKTMRLVDTDAQKWWEGKPRKEPPRHQTARQTETDIMSRVLNSLHSHIYLTFQSDSRTPQSAHSFDSSGCLDAALAHLSLSVRSASRSVGLARRRPGMGVFAFLWEHFSKQSEESGLVCRHAR